MIGVDEVRALLLGRPLHGPERYQPFFIAGSGRCGTTLLRAMLQAHPDLHIPPGNPLLRVMIRDYRWHSRLPWSVVLRAVLSRLALHPSWEAFELPLGPVYEELAARPPSRRNLAAVFAAVYGAHRQRQKPGAARWGDKSPLSVLALGDLGRVFPDLRVIYLLRDGRDVAASFADAFQDDIPRAAMVWLRAVRTAHAFRDGHPRQYLEVRYEDLVRRPEPVLRDVSAFLGISWDERVLRHHELDLRLGDVERTPHMQGVREAVHQRSIGRWRTAFDTRQIEQLERLLGPALGQLGYDLPRKPQTR